MKKALFAVVLLVSCCALFCGCIKHASNTTLPSMTAAIGTTYDFTANFVIPSTLDTQAHDSTSTLYITGTSSDVTVPFDKIVLSITKYKGVTGISSIVEGAASATYYHSGVVSPALGGIVAITRITTNSIIGYFSFSTSDGINVTNGTFTVGLP